MTKQELENEIRQQIVFIEASGKNITGVKNIMQLIDTYASQEKEKEAVEFGDFVKHSFMSSNPELAFGSTKQLYELYKEKTK